jgi:hypothetical protein
MYCICCKRNNVKPSEFKSGNSEREVPYVTEEEILWRKEARESDNFNLNINSEMIDNGIIQIISAGYRSSYDGDEIILAICDECIKDNLEDGTLLYYDNYLGVDPDWNKNHQDKSKQIYRRRKNLDGLV